MWLYWLTLSYFLRIFLSAIAFMTTNWISINPLYTSASWSSLKHWNNQHKNLWMPGVKWRWTSCLTLKLKLSDIMVASIVNSENIPSHPIKATQTIYNCGFNWWLKEQKEKKKEKESYDGRIDEEQSDWDHLRSFHRHENQLKLQYLYDACKSSNHSWASCTQNDSFC